jgi:hypothetical protein
MPRIRLDSGKRNRAGLDVNSARVRARDYCSGFAVRRKTEPTARGRQESRDADNFAQEQPLAADFVPNALRLPALRISAESERKRIWPSKHRDVAARLLLAKQTGGLTD